MISKLGSNTKKDRSCISTRKPSAGVQAWGIGFILFAYYIVYDWAYFCRPNIYQTEALTGTLKILIPCVLLCLCVYLQTPFVTRGALGQYFLLGLLFSVWLFVPSAIYTNPLNAGKFLIRFVGMIFAGMLIVQNPGIFRCYARLFIAAFCIMFIAYIFGYSAYWLSEYNDTFIDTNSAWIRLSAQSNTFENFRLVRFAGFFMEPSNASGYSVCGFFLARFLMQIDKSKIWAAVSWACLLFGMMSLSIVGYICIVSAFLFGRIYRNRFKQITVYFIGFSLIVAILISRSIVWEHYYDSPLLRAVTGLRDQSGDDLDLASSGRISLTQKSIDSGLIEYPLGVGVPSRLGEGVEEEKSSSAVIYWLCLSGPIGLCLLLTRESFVFRRLWPASYEQSHHLLLIPAWVAIATQNVGYGTFMTPGYLIIAIAVASRCSFAMHKPSTLAQHERARVSRFSMP